MAVDQTLPPCESLATRDYSAQLYNCTTSNQFAALLTNLCELGHANYEFSTGTGTEGAYGKAGDGNVTETENGN